MDHGTRRIFPHQSGSGRHIVYGAGLIVDAHTAEIEDRGRRSLQHVRQCIEIQHAARGGDAHEVIPLALQPQRGIFHGRMLPGGKEDGAGTMGIPFFGIRGAEKGEIVRFRTGGGEDHAICAHAVLQAAKSHSVCDLLPASREKFCSGQSGKMRGRGIGKIRLRRAHTVQCRLRWLCSGCVIEINHMYIPKK